jgi:hypothetical protein
MTISTFESLTFISNMRTIRFGGSKNTEQTFVYLSQIPLISNISYPYPLNEEYCFVGF